MGLTLNLYGAVFQKNIPLLLMIQLVSLHCAETKCCLDPHAPLQRVQCAELKWHTGYDTFNTARKVKVQ